MAAVTLISPRGELTRQVSDLQSLRTYVINQGWTPQTGTYADAYLTVTGTALPTPGAGAGTPGLDDQIADLVADPGSETGVELRAASVAAVDDAVDAGTLPLVTATVSGEDVTLYLAGVEL